MPSIIFRSITTFSIHVAYINSFAMFRGTDRLRSRSATCYLAPGAIRSARRSPKRNSWRGVNDFIARRELRVQGYRRYFVQEPL